MAEKEKTVTLTESALEAQLAAAKGEAHDAGNVEGFKEGLEAAAQLIESRWASPISGRMAESIRELAPAAAPVATEVAQ